MSKMLLTDLVPVDDNRKDMKMRFFAFCCLFVFFCLDAGMAGEDSSSLSAFAKRRERLSSEGNGPVCRLFSLEERKGRSRTKATLTLRVVKDWGDGSGYQLLLDSDYDTYGSLYTDQTAFFTSGGNADYSAFEVRLPESASGSISDYSWISAPDVRSLEIDPGIYDFCIANPVPNDRVWIAGGLFSTGDDFHFLAGVEYVFTVLADGTADNCVLDVSAQRDLALASLLRPQNAWSMGTEESVSVKVANPGLEAVSGFALEYVVDGNPICREPVSETLEPGDTLDYTFRTKVDLSRIGIHRIRANVDFEDDQNPLNDTLDAVFLHLAALDPPFSCRFDSVEEMAYWRTTDGNGNAGAWKYNRTASADTVPGGCISVITDEMGEDETAFFSGLMPVSLEKGYNHLSFRYKTFYSKENLCVLYGKNPDVSQMRVLREYPDLSSDGWSLIPCNFELEEAGDYYFAFQVKKNSESWSLFLDDITVDRGKYQGIPDLSLERILLPAPSCVLGPEERVGVRLANTGNGDVGRLKLACHIDGVLFALQEFDSLLEPGKIRDFYFDDEADFSQDGKTYRIAVSVEAVPLSGQKPESFLDNNADTVSLRHFQTEALPFLTDFSDAEDRNAWAGNVPDSWVIEENSGYLWNLSPGILYSGCVDLRAGEEYRLSWVYAAGEFVYFNRVTEDFLLLCGPSDSDLSAWDTLWNVKSAFTENLFVSENLRFVPSRDGSYSFAFVPLTCNRTLRLKSFQVKARLDYDLQLVAFEALPYRTPAEQASSPFKAGFRVKNSGKKPVGSSYVRILRQGKVLDSIFLSAVEPDSTVSGSITLCVRDVEAGDTVRFLAEVLLAGKEDSNPDNSMLSESHVTTSLLAYDRADSLMYADKDHIMGAAYYLECGLPFRINAADTLTAVNVGWALGSGAMESEIRIYAWDAEKRALGRLMAYQTISKDDKGGECSYPLDPILLDSGLYVVTVGIEGHVMTVDMEENGFICVVDRSKLYRYDGLGYPAVRMVLARGGRVKAFDASIEAFLQPVSDGLFTERQPVVLKVGNRGYAEASVPVRLKLNGKMLEPRILDMPPYSYAEVEYVLDLSEPQKEFLLEAYTLLENDVERSNDTLRLKVRCLRPADVEEPVSREDCRLYPNPCRDRLTLSLESPAERVSVFDLLGKERLFVQNLSGRFCVLDVAALRPGVYLLQILTERGVRVKKFVKQ